MGRTMAMNLFKKMNKNRHLFATILLVALLFVMFFSSWHIIQEADHDCCGESCEICADIAHCKTNLKQFVIEHTTALVIVVALCLFLQIISLINSFVSFETLITNKVRLNN